ncbi:uncharacterized protein LOC129948035 isoform X1 [Eupeodes corollae]|uniref:uncharacterized protein LOC129948035 isoform X1 n=1 Tax=Eupeodes corollae TaxID=290404 RepID=UPI002492800D|nr:uncharacterized protein LOC129948035 isoform X1 [Eupeodes corollae]
MFKIIVFSCVIAAVVAVAKPGILSSSLGVGVVSSPTIISVPTANIVRTVPVALGTTITAPSSQIISSGLVSGGIVSSGLVSGGLISNELVSGGLINGGLVSSGKILSGGLISGKLI